LKIWAEAVVLSLMPPFTYLLLLADKRAADPAAFVTEKASWREGVTFSIGDDRLFRILSTRRTPDGVAAKFFDGIWTVEPVSDALPP
jgi:hypothetical protein